MALYNLIKGIIKKNTRMYNKIQEVLKYYIFTCNEVKATIYRFSGKTSELEKYRNLHSGERCFIIGNGPSLLLHDLEKLEKEFTFATHRIFNIYEKTNWRPTYYVAQDLKLIDKYKNEINQLFTPKFIPINVNWKMRQKVIDKCVFFYLKKEDFYPQLPRFTEDASKKIYEGFTVTYSTIQLAVYMGFSEIYLLGIDFNYSKSINFKGDIVINKDAKDYFTNDANNNINLPNLDYSLLAYKSAKQYCERNNISIYNATRGGKLDIFERINFDDVVN